MESRIERCQPQPDSAETESAVEIYGLKEALSMLDEVDADDATVLALLDSAMLEPIPDLSDPEAKSAYRDRMTFINEVAQRLRNTTARTLEFRQMIEERITRLNDPS